MQLFTAACCTSSRTRSGLVNICRWYRLCW